MENKYRMMKEWSADFDEKVRRGDGTVGIEELVVLINEINPKPKEMEEELEGEIMSEGRLAQRWSCSLAQCLI